MPSRKIPASQLLKIFRLSKREPVLLLTLLLAGALLFYFSGDKENDKAALDTSKAFSGKVTKVADGDTLTVNKKIKIRLAGIDAPELAHGGQPAQYFGSESGKALKSLVLGKSVEVIPLTKDRYGRLVADVTTPEEGSSSEYMLRNGFAFLYPYKDIPKKFLDKLLKVQREAISEKRGFWPHILSLDKSSGKTKKAKGPYTGNSSSKRFHSPGCTLKPPGSKNIIYFDSLRDAFYAGYSPARECTPWPNIKK